MPDFTKYFYFNFNSNNNNNNNNDDESIIDADNTINKGAELSALRNKNKKGNEYEDDADISNLEMARQFQLFKIQKPNIVKTDALTFRKCRLQANDIKKQINNDDFTEVKKNKKRNKTDDIPKFDDSNFNSTEKIKSESVKRIKSDTDLKLSEYDDKWLRILKGVNRRNFTIGRKYTHTEERVWNNVSIQSLYTGSPNDLELTDMIAVD